MKLNPPLLSVRYATASFIPASLAGDAGNAMSNAGRLGDYYDDYSPYRSIDDLKKTNGYNDLASHQCLHVFACAVCNSEQIISIDEWKQSRTTAL